jgi:endonuclease/exonuclease/phosphatase family metal-dependent hydrolase
MRTAVHQKALEASDVEKPDSSPRPRSSFWLAGALILGLLAGPRYVLAGPVTLASYNLYLGADLDPIVAAPPGLPFLAAVGAAFGNVVATDFNVRASAIADQIAATQPHFIGLQEAVTWRTGPADSLGPSPTPATTVAFDFVPILLNALTARGLSYAPIAQVQNVDIEVPGALSPTELIDIRLTDRDALLARTDLPGGITHANPQAQNFATAIPITVAGMSISLLRGWTATDVTVDGKTFRLVNTHLEVASELVRLAQLQELLVGPGNTALPLVFLGDFNSEADPPADPAGATYAALLAAGFTDAGLLGGIGGEATCCQSANLMNELSLLETRIDLALFRGAFQVLLADVIGEAQEDRSASGGLWPSDHAGIVVTLNVPEPSIMLLVAFGLGLLVFPAARGHRRVTV